MNMQSTDRLETSRLFWKEMGEVRAVMLGSPDPTHHMQPMSPIAVPEEHAVWFFTRKSSDLAQSLVPSGGTVHMCLVNEAFTFHACATGRLGVNHSQEHIDRYWSPMISAWFLGGKTDSDMTMLRFSPKSAGVWFSTDSSIRFAWETARANLSGQLPDLGYSAKIQF